MVAGPSSEFVTEFFVQNGEKPFEVKIKGLKDPVAQTRIYARLAKVRSGTLGDQKALGKGLWELKVDYGPGYRVYFGKYDSQVHIPLDADRDSGTKAITIPGGCR